MIDPLYVVSGFGVGLLVGMTGVGGGSLMTPLLILLFGIHPATAVGTDLLYASATKTGGTLAHGWAGSIHWPAVIRLMAGSIPASVLTLVVLWQLDLNAEASRSLVNLVLCFALVLTTSRIAFVDLDCRNFRPERRPLDRSLNPSPPRCPRCHACVGQATSCQARTPPSRDCRQRRSAGRSSQESARRRRGRKIPPGSTPVSDGSLSCRNRQLPGRRESRRSCDAIAAPRRGKMKCDGGAWCSRARELTASYRHGPRR